MPDFRKVDSNSRVRLVYEVNVSATSRHNIYNENGTEFRTDGLVSIEALTPKLPTTPGSRATFKLKGEDWDEVIGVLIGETWFNIRTGGEIRPYAPDLDIISVDRIGA